MLGLVCRWCVVVGVGCLRWVLCLVWSRGFGVAVELVLVCVRVRVRACACVTFITVPISA